MEIAASSSPRSTCWSIVALGGSKRITDRGSPRNAHGLPPCSLIVPVMRYVPAGKKT